VKYINNEIEQSQNVFQILKGGLIKISIRELAASVFS
jgi:hypothetical protein